VAREASPRSQLAGIDLFGAWKWQQKAARRCGHGRPKLPNPWRNSVGIFHSAKTFSHWIGWIKTCFYPMFITPRWDRLVVRRELCLRARSQRQSRQLTGFLTTSKWSFGDNLVTQLCLPILRGPLKRWGIVNMGTYKQQCCSRDPAGCLTLTCPLRASRNSQISVSSTGGEVMNSTITGPLVEPISS
jgi:hypothetical protein